MLLGHCGPWRVTTIYSLSWTCNVATTFTGYVEIHGFCVISASKEMISRLILSTTSQSPGFLAITHSVSSHRLIESFFYLADYQPCAHISDPIIYPLF